MKRVFLSFFSISVENQIGVIFFFDLIFVLFGVSSSLFLAIYIFTIYIFRLSFCMIIIISNLVSGWSTFFYFCTIFLTFWPSLDKRFWTLISCFFSSFSFLVKQHRLIIHPFSCQFLSSYFWGKNMNQINYYNLISLTCLKLYKVWRMK